MFQSILHKSTHRLGFFLFCLFLLLPYLIQSQNLVLNSKPIEKNKYEDYQGSPYLFNDWMKGMLKNNQGKIINNLWINFNGLTNELEVTQDKKNYVVANPSLHPEVTIQSPIAQEALKLTYLPSLHFIKKPHPKLPAAYYLILFNNNSHQLLYEYSVSEATIVQRPPGQIIEIKRLRKVFRLLLISGKDWQVFSLNKKEIKKTFEKIGNIGVWAKEKKLRLDKLETLIKYLEFSAQ